jgi:hypothetical protein
MLKGAGEKLRERLCIKSFLYRACNEVSSPATFVKLRLLISAWKICHFRAGDVVEV